MPRMMPLTAAWTYFFAIRLAAAHKPGTGPGVDACRRMMKPMVPEVI